MMSPAFSVALLLLSAIVVKSVEGKNEEELKLKDIRVGHHAEEILEVKGKRQDLCGGCKSLVTKVKEKMDKDSSKDNVAKLVDEVCSEEKDELVQAACQKITGKVKDKLIAAVAKDDDPKTVCKKVKLCKKKKKKPPPHL